MLSRFTVLLLLCCATVLAAPSLTLSGETAGEQLKVNVIAADMADFAGLQFGLSFDEAILSFDRVEEGSFLNEGGTVETEFPTELLRTGDGAVEDIVLFRVGAPEGVTGSGVVLSAYFDRSADADVAFTDALVSDSVGEPIIAELYDLTLEQPATPRRSSTGGGALGRAAETLVEEKTTPEAPEKPPTLLQRIKEAVLPAKAAAPEQVAETGNALTGNVIAEGSPDAPERTLAAPFWATGALIVVAVAGLWLYSYRMREDAPVTVSDQQRLLLNAYVRVMRVHGRGEFEIMNALEEQGWRPDVVEELLARFRFEPALDLEAETEKNLVLYVYGMAAQGATGKAIAENLVRNGWSWSHVERVLA